MTTRDERIKEMQQNVCKANLRLPDEGLIKLTWGNVSEVDYDYNIIVIKPSGVSYSLMKSEHMVVTDLDGNILQGTYKASSDLATHVTLYKNFKDIRSVVHTHSKYAVMWAQANRDIPVYGTTHADAFYGPIPCTRDLTAEEIKKAYEAETGNVIVETFKQRFIDPNAVPGVIVHSHGPFTWGKSVNAAVENSIILEEVAEMALHTESLSSSRPPISNHLLDKHYYRKHGSDAYYGQK
ncbi:L-ribulose-5-phosphate 4-epimerase [Bacillus sp. J14TS2]|uniref:L-ribulose-5-phosphate 4-epimerase AraD n=1 Tax=Bacillus sp. J14TS2 TaxID=2807188 RepID=UPI001B1C8785|nr:L-ribulose-5-phosphate 4-epimerase AraD [Bacillus sp. J14TS2]GIN69527.1 L-ribulose-5-phosphate 4-epimerase [Bacillus sp. J14TS2]